MTEPVAKFFDTMRLTYPKRDHQIIDHAQKLVDEDPEASIGFFTAKMKDVKSMDPFESILNAMLVSAAWFEMALR